MDGKVGDLCLQYGGEPISRTEFKNSDAPILHTDPRFNQAVIFKNSNSGHMVEPIVSCPIFGMQSRKCYDCGFYPFLLSKILESKMIKKCFIRAYIDDLAQFSGAV